MSTENSTNFAEKSQTPLRHLDKVHPNHYHGTRVMEVIEEFKLGFCLGNAVKYILRAEEKGEAATDVLKAQWYLDRWLSHNAKA